MATEGLHADLVLEGGGVKGIGLVGAYATLQDRGYQIHRIVGTSAGAIVGALIAAGISPVELETTSTRSAAPCRWRSRCSAR